MKLFLSVAALASVTWAMSWDSQYLDDGVTFEDLELVPMFEEWKFVFGKTYENMEVEAHHFLTWTENFKMILDHNAGDSSFTMKLNQFGDLSGDEFRLAVHGHTGSCMKEGDARRKLSTFDRTTLQLALDKKKTTSDAPTSIDWTTKGVVTPVKNQGSCGSCWAFSTTGSTECRYAIATGTLNSLSEQELVDCSRSYGNEGCDGGLMDYGFEYVKANDGLCSEEEYPYKGEDGICKKEDCSTRYNPISGYTDVTSDDEDALMDAVADGCVSVAVEADQSSFQFYSGGVLKGRCGTSLDHGVLVVGYGSESGEDYWKVKNSWGRTWGMDGYLLICRDCDENGDKGECGIDMEPSFPTAQT